MAHAMAGPSDPPMTPEEAFCVFPCLAMQEDGSVLAEEQEALEARLQASLADGFSKALLARVHKRIRSMGEDALLVEAAAVLSPSLRDEAYRATLDIVYSDGDASQESGYLARVRRVLGVTRP